MLNIRAFEIGYYPIRGFLAWEEGDREAVFIDPGGWDEAILDTLQAHGLTLAAILLTHGHDDHTGGLAQMAAHCPAPVHAHAADLPLLKVRPDVVLHGGEAIRCGTRAWQALPVPGHTAGCLAYTADAVVFSGDTLFAGSIGGTRGLPEFEQERFSIRTQLFRLGDATRVYPAHGPATSIGIERRCNPFLRGIG